MADSQDMLQDTVYQLLSHNIKTDEVLKEVLSMQPLTTGKKMFPLLAELGYGPAFQAHSELTEKRGDKQGISACMKKLDFFLDKELLTEDEQQEFEAAASLLSRMMESAPPHILHLNDIQVSHLYDRLTGSAEIPLFVLWTLQKENIISLDTYLNRSVCIVYILWSRYAFPY